MVQHPIALAGIYKVLAKFHNKFLNNVKVACFRFLPCTMPALRMLWSGQVAKDFAWQQQWNRQAANNPRVCTVPAYFMFQGTFLSVLAFDSRREPRRPSCFCFPDDDTDIERGGGDLIKGTWLIKITVEIHTTFPILRPRNFSSRFRRGANTLY